MLSDDEILEIFDAPYWLRDGLRAVANAAAKNALEEAAKKALNDWVEGRVRGRLWHEWLIRLAASIPTATKENERG